MRRRQRLFVATGCTLAAMRLLVFPVTVVGNSMRPHYYPGDKVLALRLVRRWLPLTSRVVVVRHPRGHGGAQLLIKRVTAVGGVAAPLGGLVPPRHIYIRGEGEGSLDSRQLGFLRADSIKGVVIARIWRPRKAGGC